jgi:hypothetical protein
MVQDRVKELVLHASAAACEDKVRAEQLRSKKVLTQAEEGQVETASTSENEPKRRALIPLKLDLPQFGCFLSEKTEGESGSKFPAVREGEALFPSVECDFYASEVFREEYRLNRSRRWRRDLNDYKPDSEQEAARQRLDREPRLPDALHHNPSGASERLDQIRRWEQPGRVRWISLVFGEDEDRVTRWYAPSEGSDESVNSLRFEGVLKGENRLHAWGSRHDERLPESKRYMYDAVCGTLGFLVERGQHKVATHGNDNPQEETLPNGQRLSEVLVDLDISLLEAEAEVEEKPEAGGLKGFEEAAPLLKAEAGGLQVESEGEEASSISAHAGEREKNTRNTVFSTGPVPPRRGNAGSLWSGTVTHVFGIF